MITDIMQIKTQKTAKSKIQNIDWKNLGFGKHFSDHVFIADYNNNQWENARIIPYGDMLMSPATSALHYGQSIFEGMKAYKMDNNGVGIFRPYSNYKRLNISAKRMAMPDVAEEIFMEGILQLVRLDSEWVPKEDGSALYIRPLYMGTDEYIGVKASDSYQLIILTCPVGRYYNEPLKVYVETNYIRAVEGGVGFVKASGNYGRSLYPTKLANAKGYHQVIWTDATHHRYVEESGTMNLMFVIDVTLITPPTGDTILAGITRDSVLTIAKDWKMKVEERKISLDEIIDAHKKGTLQEAFGCGTAATIANIKLIGFEEKDYELPPITEKGFAARVLNELNNIRKGRAADIHNWMYRI